MRNLNASIDPFIKILNLNGNESEISLLEALIHAQNYKAICGDCLPQDKSIENLLLGILQKIFQEHNANGKYEPLTSPEQAENRWIQIWKAGQFPEQPIREYLEKYKDYFNLIDPVHPFFQVHETEKQIEFKASNGKTVKGDGHNPRSIGKLVGTLFASGSRPRVWADRYFDEKNTLTQEEAIRWLIFINNYDDASFKKPPTDIHVAFRGQITSIYAEGANLFETLMLNLPLCQGDQLWKSNTPYWEMEPFTRSQMVLPPPDNPSLLLTFPYRRMHLNFDEDGNVTGYELTGHHSFPTDNYTIEQNGIFKEGDPKKGTSLSFRKLPSDLLWKNYGDLFLDNSEAPKPGIINWITKIVDNEDFDLSVPALRFRAVSVAYKSMQCVFAEMSDDTVVMNSFLLADNSLIWRELIASTVADLKKCARATGYLYKNLAIAAGEDPKNDSPLKQGEEEFWRRIDTPFRAWLASITKLSEIVSTQGQMKDQIYSVIHQILNERRQSATLKMALGTTKKIKKGKTEVEVTYNLQKSCGAYYYSIEQILGPSATKQKQSTLSDTGAPSAVQTA